MELIEFLRRKLSPEALALLRAEIEDPGDVDYEAAIRRVVKRLKNDEELFAFARTRLELRSSNLLDLPGGRRLTLLRNSSPISLLVLFHDLIRRSYGERFGDVKRSLDLANLATEVARVIAGSTYLSKRDAADVLAEAYAYLGNAKRINADMLGARKALMIALGHASRGTGDQMLAADLLHFRAVLLVAEGRCLEAAELTDHEIPLRRLLGDEKKLGFTLVQRGWIGCLIGEPSAKITDYFQAGLSRVPEDHRLALQALHAFAELLARDQQGSSAWRMLIGAEGPLQSVKGERFQTQHRWITGLAHRAIREMEQAARLLAGVRDDLARSGVTDRLALVSLDLASVYAAEGELDRVRELTEEAYRLYRAAGLEERALTAVVVLQEAIEAERVTEGLAVAVANFLARFPYNKALRFEWKGE